MAAPVLSTDFQIGLDNAMIQVAQNYTVPANPPSTPNPPTNWLTQPTNTATTTTKDSVTIYVSAIKGFNNPLTMSFMIERVNNYVDLSLPTPDVTTAFWQGDIGMDISTWITGTSVTLPNGDTGWRGLLGFNLVPNGDSMVNPLNTYEAQNYRTLWINPQGTGGAIDPNHPPSYQVNIYAFDPITNTYAACSFTLVVMPSVANYGIGVTETIPAANTYVNQNSGVGTKTLYVASTSGFNVGDSIDIGMNTARYEVGVVASTTSTSLVLSVGLTNTHTAVQADTVTGNRLFGNSVTLKYDGANPAINNYAIVFFNFYPLESAGIVNQTPSPIAVTIDAVDKDGIIDYTNSTIIGYPMVSPTSLTGYFLAQALAPPPPIELPIHLTRDMPLVRPDLYVIEFRLYLFDWATAHPGLPLPTKSVLLKVTGADANGVSVSGYTKITPVVS